MALQFVIEEGKVWSITRPRNLQESKQLIQECVKYADTSGVKRHRGWLRMIHGSMINKIIDSWIEEVSLGERV